MNDTQPAPPKKVSRKVKVTLSITKEAQDLMLDHGYASARTMGDFISRLIVEYHQQQLRQKERATSGTG